ncbi:BZ3500_MvSof-1268-A1-R1_Chr3-1g05530 [Microbotryum saponariae]|uniref:BZ3500_MvSof-1268-A1-R1_Chr3-1g05530 protein n=1 Tax=Microbotryum saponariae TaxID=289078 RepID=A0A2X0KZV5_9BASI|nr:BZ3500_MvSof-1268-A1-R1_Chr3-1g05530 [Microbotryum saponariae]SDA04721.1 BZ3501_MvSof-1269-A2-R1_Chr3-1g05201 [Microbotryum saponariae]
MFHFVQPAAFESTAVPFSAMPCEFDPRRHHRSATSASSPFGATLATSAPAGFDSFEEYDEYRSRQELEALIRGQEQRRQREAAVLLARRRQEAEQIRQQALLRAQQEQQQRAKYQALLEQQAAQLEHLRQQEEMKLRTKREIERRQAIQKAQQLQQKQQKQQQQQHPLLNSLDSTTPPGCPARRRRQPLEHSTGLRRNHQAEVQHPFAPLFRMLFDSGEDEQDQDQNPSSTPSAQTPESTKQQVETTQAPPAASAPVAQPLASTEPQVAVSADKDQEAPVDSLEDVLGSLFKSLFGVDVKANEQREAKAALETQAPTAKRESSSTAPMAAAEKNIQVPIESSSVDAQTLDPVEVRIEATQENLVASAEQESAAEKLQRHYQAHLQRRKALATLSSLSAQFEARRSSFAVPQALEFQPSPPPSEHPDSTSNEVAPKLAYKSSNAPFLAYEDFLVNLLSKIDEVQSGGDRTIKSARKSLVKDVEAELKTLDQARDEAWEKVSSQHQHEKISDGDDHENETLKSLIPASEETTATGAAARPTEVATATSEIAHAEASSIAEDAPAPTPASAPETEPAQSNEDKPKVEQDDEATTSTEKAAQVTDSEPVFEVAAQPPVVSTPTPEPVPLTPEALAKLSSHAERRRRHPEDDDNSSSSTTTLLESSLEIEEALGAILAQARKLGEQVERMEHAEV